jgi:uncharacterized protein
MNFKRALRPPILPQEAIPEEEQRTIRNSDGNTSGKKDKGKNFRKVTERRNPGIKPVKITVTWHCRKFRWNAVKWELSSKMVPICVLYKCYWLLASGYWFTAFQRFQNPCPSASPIKRSGGVRRAYFLLFPDSRDLHCITIFLITFVISEFSKFSVMKETMYLRFFVFISFWFILSSRISIAQSISGDWHGFVKVNGIPLRLDVHLREENGKLSGTFDNPDQGKFNLRLTTISLDKQNFRFFYEHMGLSYLGKFDRENGKISGIIKMGTALNDSVVFSREMPEPPENSLERIKEIYDKQEVYIPMRDGIKLFTSIYSPRKTDGTAPVLMVRTPYCAESDGEKQFNFYLPIYVRFVNEGYILVFQDVRGRFMSEGKFVNVRPYIPDKTGNETDEASDTYDTADWLIKNVKNNNGRIGVFGVSYPGFYSTMAILAQHPAIKAVSPQAPVTNWFIGDDEHHNGAFFLMDNFSFYNWFVDPMTVPTRTAKSGFTWNSEDSYEYFMKLGPLKNTNRFFPDSVKYWHELFSHPNYDSWWKKTDPRPYLTHVMPAVMTVGGWFDAEDMWGTLHTYQAIEKQNSPGTKNILVMGPWEHGQWASEGGKNLGNIYWGTATCDDFHKMEVRFFNYYLKDEGMMDLPEATVFLTGTNEWRQFPTWPPKNTVQKIFWFEPSGGLDTVSPAGMKSFDEYISDPQKPVPYREDVHLYRDPAYMDDDQRFAARRPDVLVYQTDTLTVDFTLTGPVTADLFVSTSGTDADFVVKLIDVFPDEVKKPDGAEIEVPLGGYQMLVRAEIMRGKYRNSLEYPEPFKPGKITHVQFELPDIAHTFKKGHRMMVQVQSSWFPLVDRNPQKYTDIYTCGESDFQKATMRIYHDKQHGSNIKVNVLGK